MVKGQPNEAIVRELSPSSRFLGELHRQFNNIFTLDDSTIISWYETKGTATIEVCLFCFDNCLLAISRR